MNQHSYNFSGAYGPATGGAAATLLPASKEHFYGATKPQEHARGINAKGIFVCLFVPWFTFVAVLLVQSFGFHYTYPMCANCFCGVVFVIVFYICFKAMQDAVQKIRSGSVEPTWYAVLALAALVAWCVGMWCGQYNFHTNMQPYYDISSMNMYKSVDPANSSQQFMDAGRVAFVPEARLDLQRSMGFRDRDTYCVVPIVSGNDTQASADFWAVGLNCCSGHAADFHCGAYDDPKTRSGLRVMDEGRRSFFRLAVLQAEAAYNMRANHAVFLYWLPDPSTEMNAYEDDGAKFAVTCVCTYFGFQLLAIAIVAAVYFKVFGPLGLPGVY